MPVLKNARHERFAQLLAAGETQDRAYSTAGYKPDAGAASRMSRNIKVSRRITELLNRSAAKLDITRESLTQMFLHDRLRADELEQISAAVSAGEKIGKLYGLFVDKAEITGKDGKPIEFADVSDIDRAKAIASLVARSKQVPAVH